MSDTSDDFPADTARIMALAEAAIAGLPEPFRAAAAKVVLRVADFAPDELLQELGCESPFDLTGLYEGIPLTEKSFSDQPMQPDVIWWRMSMCMNWPIISAGRMSRSPRLIRGGNSGRAPKPRPSVECCLPSPDPPLRWRPSGRHPPPP